MAAVDLKIAIRRNEEQQQQIQERLRQVLSASAVRQQTIVEQQRLLADLYREIEQLMQELKTLKRQQAGLLSHPRARP
jgi:DNA repair exonuclease SbcCD ATPase subunit